MTDLKLHEYHDPYIQEEIGRWGFTLPILPEGKQRPIPWAAGKTITPEQTRKAEKRLLAYAEEHQPPYPISNPVLLGLDFVFPIPEDWSEAKTQLALDGRILHKAKPDLSNLIKLVEDALNGKFWADDSAIGGYLWPPRKRYGASPAIHVEIVVLKEHEEILHERSST